MLFHPIVPPSQLISPGRAIGHIYLSEKDEQVQRSLGRPKYGDAAMGHFWATWERKGRVLDVYSVRGERDPRVRIVRITSPAFRTSSGIGPGSLQSAVLARFPSARRISRFTAPSEGVVTELFDDIRLGITFEFQAQKCFAVSIHPRGSRVDGEYAPMVSYLKERSSLRQHPED